VKPGRVFLRCIEVLPDSFTGELKLVAKCGQVRELVCQDDQELLSRRLGTGLDAVLLAGPPGPGLLLPGHGRPLVRLCGEQDQAQHMLPEFPPDVLRRAASVLQQVVQDAANDHLLRDPRLTQQEPGHVQDVHNVRRPANLAGLAAVVLKGKGQGLLDSIHATYLQARTSHRIGLIVACLP